MVQYRCSKCGCEISYKYGKCSDCLKEIYQQQIEKRKNRILSKRKATIQYGIDQVKKFADGKKWAGSHASCFRCSLPGKGEKTEHIYKKFERWLYHRELGRTVFCELVLKEGFGRPDLIIIDRDENVFIEEIVNSEKEASIILKKKKYPFPIKVIKTKGD